MGGNYGINLTNKVGVKQREKVHLASKITPLEGGVIGVGNK